MITTERIATLTERAKKLRRETIEIALASGHTHYGASFSVVEILVALATEILTQSDKMILSKGHGCLALYPLLRELGFTPTIGAHPDRDEENGIVCTTGSLGHGLPMGVGMAFARRLTRRGGRIVVVMGDGECQEGTTWESLNLARRYALDNLTIVVDHNKLQALDSLETVMGDPALRSKFTAFGCATREVDGHDFEELLEALGAAAITRGAPQAVIAHTVKGKGISFMENDPKWHTRAMNEAELRQAMRELA
jgi:transketolase